MLINPSREEVRKLLRSAQGIYYIYMLSRPCGTPFYVGKGSGDRVFCHERDALQTTLRSHKLNTIRALHANDRQVGYSIELMSGKLEALARERELTQSYGRHDLGTGPLTNMTDGGEGPANFSEQTRQKHRDTLASNLEDGSARSAVNAFFLKLGIPVDSIPIKPLGERRLEPLTPHPNARKPTRRQAAALAAAVIGNRMILAPQAQFKRRFSLEDGEAVIENGVGRDMLKSGMISVSNPKPGDEMLEVSEFGYRTTLSQVGRETLTSFGALLPLV